MNNNVITVDLNASPRTISRPLYQYDKAVRRFQEAERLDVDGIAGPKTWARLLARD